MKTLCAIKDWIYALNDWQLTCLVCGLGLVWWMVFFGALRLVQAGRLGVNDGRGGDEK